MLLVLLKLKWFFREYWKRYSIVIGVFLIVNIVEVIFLKVLGVMIDNIKIGMLLNEVII